MNNKHLPTKLSTKLFLHPLYMSYYTVLANHLFLKIFFRSTRGFACVNYVFLKPFALRFILNWAELHSQDEPLRRGGGHISFVLKTRKPLLLHSSKKWSTQQNTTHTHELLVQILLSDELVK